MVPTGDTALNHWGSPCWRIYGASELSLYQVMVCRLFHAKLLPKPMVTYILLMTIKSKVQWNLNQNTTISFPKMKMLSAKWRLFCCGLNVLMLYVTYTSCWIRRGRRWHRVPVTSVTAFPNVSSSWPTVTALPNVSSSWPSERSDHNGLVIITAPATDRANKAWRVYAYTTKRNVSMA